MSASSDSDPGFAPEDYTDARKPFDWATRYSEPEAQQGIRLEAIYMAAVMFLYAAAITLFLSGLVETWLADTMPAFDLFEKYLLAWASGGLGGSVLAVKWLYHSTAKGIWNIDRRLWRLFTPHVSGAMALGFVALITSGLLSLFNSESLENGQVIVGVGFLVGYFSDQAAAKLTEIAGTLFGTSRR